MSKVKVRMKTSFAGAETWPAGSIQNFDKVEADRMVSMGYAEYVIEKRTRSKRIQKPKESR